jgi:hypothetical protein
MPELFGGHQPNSRRTQNQWSYLCLALSSPVFSVVAMIVGATDAATVACEYTPFEVQQIQATCSLTPDIYEANLPEVSVRMLEEGHTKIWT